MTVPEYIYAEAINAGMTNEGACGLLGNIQEESAFVTNNLENRANGILNLTDEEYTALVDSGRWNDFATDNGVHGGYGLIQVTEASRKRRFLLFMQSRGKSIADLEGQVAFILWEMRHMFPSVWRTVTTSNNLKDCTWMILDVYENPKEKTENMKRRYAYAQQWLAQLGNKEVLRKMTEQEAIGIVLNTARNQIGTHETGDNVTTYAAYMDSIPGFYNGPKNGYPWCDVFVDYCFVKSFGVETGREMICQPMQSAGAGCLYSAQYYKQAGRWVTYPQPGDQIFFSYAAGEYSHTGIVESIANGMVNTIEGNTSDMVARRSYPLASGSIVGYGRPRWDLVAGTSAADIAASTPDPSEAASGGASSQTILKIGMKGEAVRKLQSDLIKLGYDVGVDGADGDFGNNTFKAVVLFQRNHKLSPVDGEAGPDTLGAIETALANVEVYEPKSNAQVQTTIGLIKPDPISVIVEPIENEAPLEDRFEFHEGDIVNFVGNGHYFSPTAKVGFTCKPGRAMVNGLDRRPTAKHPYRLRAIRGGGSTVNGWVDVDAIEAE